MQIFWILNITYSELLKLNQIYIYCDEQNVYHKFHSCLIYCCYGTSILKYFNSTLKFYYTSYNFSIENCYMEYALNSKKT